MRNSIKIQLVLMLSLASANFGVQASDCVDVETSYQQCKFEISHMVDGEIQVFNNTNNKYFKGAIAAKCLSGAVNFGKSSCTPQDPTQCSITKSNWSSSNSSQCSHGNKVDLLVDGELKKITSDNKMGFIEYRCDNGILKTTDLECLGGSASAYVPSTTSQNSNVVPINIEPLNNVQSFSNQSGVSVVTLPLRVENVTVSRDSAALQACMAVVDDFDVRRDTAAFRDPTSNIVDCIFKVESLLCDQGVMVDVFVDSPTLTALECRNAGYDKSSGRLSSDVLALSHSFGDINLYSRAFLCSADTSGGSCSSPPALGSNHVVNPTNCFVAKVTSKLLPTPKGSFPTTSTLLSEVCEPLSFTSVQGTPNPVFNIVQTIGSTDYVEATISCGGYSDGNETPLLNNCNAGFGAPPGLIGDVADGCDEGKVFREISGERSPSNPLDFSSPNSTTVLNQLCIPKGYTTLISILSADPSTGGFYSIEAQCGGYTGDDRNSCRINPCLGRVIDPNYGLNTIVINGVSYEDLCAAPLDNSVFEDLCKDCVPESISFSDSSNGNICSVVSATLLSGEPREFYFANSNNTGQVSLYCDNGDLTVDPTGICYQTCSGGSIAWGSNTQSNACSQTIPTGDYIHNETVNLGTSSTHTGNASFRCDGNTGEWVQTTGSCKLNCSGDFNWGGGTSGNGQNKNGLCLASISTISDGVTGSRISTTTGTNGTASYRCDDGTINVTSHSCDVSCPQSNMVWGGACAAIVYETPTNFTKTVDHGDVSVSHPFPDTISGTAEYACNDGALSIMSQSCSYVVRIDTPAWDDWARISRNEISRTPSADTVPYPDVFDQTVSYADIDRQYRTPYQVWNDGRTSDLPKQSQDRNVTTEVTSSVIGTLRVQIDSEWGPYGSWYLRNTTCDTSTTTYLLNSDLELNVTSCTYYETRLSYLTLVYNLPTYRVESTNARTQYRDNTSVTDEYCTENGNRVDCYEMNTDETYVWSSVSGSEQFRDQKESDQDCRDWHDGLIRVGVPVGSSCSVLNSVRKYAGTPLDINPIDSIWRPGRYCVAPGLLQTCIVESVTPPPPPSGIAKVWSAPYNASDAVSYVQSQIFCELALDDGGTQIMEGNACSIIGQINTFATRLNNPIKVRTATGWKYQCIVSRSSQICETCEQKPQWKNGKLVMTCD